MKEKDEEINLFPELTRPVEETISPIPFKKRKGFVPGISGNKKGKPKGSVSIKTKIIKEFTESIISDNIVAFRKNLKALKGKQHVDAMISLLEYSIPKQNRTEFNDETKNEEKVQEIFIIGGKELIW